MPSTHVTSNTDFMSNLLQQMRATFLTSKTRQLLVAAVLIALAFIGLSVSHDDKVAPAAHATNTATAEPQPDTIIDNAQLDSFDETGRKIRQLNGKKITYFDADQRSLIEAPHLYVLRRSNDKTTETPWEVTADSATAYQSSSIIDLYGNVTLFSNATPNGPTRITSEYLHVNADRKLAQTDKAVTIHVRNSVSHAVGMWADIGRDHLLLPSRVKEIHEAPR